MSQDKSRAPDQRIAVKGMSGGPKLASRVNTGLDSSETIFNFFRSIALFSLLDADEVAQVLRICTIETAAPGEILFDEGEAAKSMLILEHGEVTVTKRSQGGQVQIANLGDGSIIGEMALIAGAPRSARVKAVAETRFYRLDGRHFDALRRQRSLAAYKILLMLLETLGDRHQMMLKRVHELFAHPEDHIEIFERHCRELIERAQRALE
ncbi:MAG: hypothetical protein CMH57_13470 [Myxococcales bacterium]|nr:hypothetical protein [Myxococcales bacterium]